MPEHTALAQLVGVGFVARMALFAPASSSAFSREGRQFWIAKTIPVPAHVQVQGKPAQGYFAITCALPFLILFGALVAGRTIWQLTIVIVLGLLVSLPVIQANLLVDLINPYLNWENPQQSIKQNLNVLLGMIIGSGIIYAQGLLAYRLWQAEQSMGLIVLAVGVTTLVLGAVLYAILHKTADRLYNRVRT